jgi:hypothetical protein
MTDLKVGCGYHRRVYSFIFTQLSDFEYFPGFVVTVQSLLCRTLRFFQI